MKENSLLWFYGNGKITSGYDLMPDVVSSNKIVLHNDIRYKIQCGEFNCIRIFELYADMAIIFVWYKILNSYTLCYVL